MGLTSPIDGELGLGGSETVISRLRRHATDMLNLNDNDNPAAFDIGDYFVTMEMAAIRPSMSRPKPGELLTLSYLEILILLAVDLYALKFPQHFKLFLTESIQEHDSSFAVARPSTVTPVTPLQLSVAFDGGSSSLTANLSLSAPVYSASTFAAAFAGGTSSLSRESFFGCSTFPNSTLYCVRERHHLLLPRTFL